MEKEIDFDFDNLGMDSEYFESKHKTAVGLYAKGEHGARGELIQSLYVENLANISINYENKVFRAEYIGDGRNGFKKGTIFDIPFYSMVIC